MASMAQRTSGTRRHSHGWNLGIKWRSRDVAKSGSQIPIRRVGGSRPAAGPADLIVVLPLTSTERGIPLHVRVRKGDGGIENDSTILCEAIRSISKDRLISKWGALSREAIAEVEDRLRILLDL